MQNISMHQHHSSKSKVYLSNLSQGHWRGVPLTRWGRIRSFRAMWTLLTNTPTPRTCTQNIHTSATTRTQPTWPPWLRFPNSTPSRTAWPTLQQLWQAIYFPPRTTLLPEKEGWRWMMWCDILWERLAVASRVRLRKIHSCECPRNVIEILFTLYCCKSCFFI